MAPTKAKRFRALRKGEGAQFKATPISVSSVKTSANKNQKLVEALRSLATAMLRAQSSNAKNRFKARAIEKAADALSKLDYEITSGAQVSSGSSNKVAGVGKGTAAYIDQFLEKGEILEIQKYNKMAEGSMARAKEDEGGLLDNGVDDAVHINRAPVLTLWVVVVAEIAGFSREEACTYGRWVAGMLAQSKGRALGIFDTPEPSEGTQQKSRAKRRKSESFVDVFGQMRIPVIQVDGKKLAVRDGGAIDPSEVEEYLSRSFGDQFFLVENSMKELARSRPVDDLKASAYQLYERFSSRVEGLGQKVHLETLYFE